MRVIIDASNTTEGGGLTYLKMLSSNPAAQGYFDVIELYASSSVLAQIADAPGLIKNTHKWLNANVLYRELWRKFIFARHVKWAQRDGHSLLFSTGTNVYPRGIRYVTMMQNLLPFNKKERCRYRFFSYQRFRVFLLSKSQRKSLARAMGIIVLTRAMLDYLPSRAKRADISVIPHGIDMHAANLKTNRSISKGRVIKALYVSAIDVYKHQDCVVEAIRLLNRRGCHIALEVVGNVRYAPAFTQLEKTIQRCDPAKNWVHYRGELHGKALQKAYQEADLFVNASTCETFGLVLTEAMSFGLPVVAYDMPVNHEVLGEMGLFFKTLDPQDIAQEIQRLLDSPGQYAAQSALAYSRAQDFTWEKTARETLKFLHDVSRNIKDKRH